MLDSKPLRSVTADEQQQFRRDGVAVLRKIYPPEWVERLREALDDVFAQSLQRNKLYGDGVFHGASQQGSSSNMVAVLAEAQQRDPDAVLALEGDASAPAAGISFVETDASSWHDGMRRHNLTSPIAQILHELTGSSQINFYSDQLFLKGAGSRIKTPFHQDKPYFLVDGGEVAVVWASVDAVDRENGAMGYVRGSHLWGKLFKPSDFRTETGTFPEVGGIDFTGLDVLDHSRIRPEDLVYFDTEPGDLIVHHWATLHGSSGNTSTTRSRRAASIRYALQGCRYFARPSSPEPFRNTVDLKDGDPLESSRRFPIVWPR